MMINKFIVVKLAVIGIHRWPNAEEFEPKVGFLRYPHSHHFEITCKKKVDRNDREIEILLFKQTVEKYLDETFKDPKTGILNFDAMSCEDICEHLLRKFDLSVCEVMEDQWVGAILTS